MGWAVNWAERALRCSRAGMMRKLGRGFGCWAAVPTGWVEGVGPKPGLVSFLNPSFPISKLHPN